MADENLEDKINKPLSKRAQLYRDRKWRKRIAITNVVEKSLAYALSEVERVSSGAPRQIRETAALIYRKAVNKRITNYYHGVDRVVAASVYAAYRQGSIPRTLEEIASCSGKANKKEIGRTYKHLAKVLRLKYNPIRSEDYLSRFCMELSLSSEAEQKAGKILDMAEKEGLTSGKAAQGVTGAALYIASIICNEIRSQKQCAKAASVGVETLRQRYKELMEKVDINSLYDQK